MTKVRMKQVHFRIEWELYRQFRSMFPDKGDLQRIVRQLLVDFLEKRRRDYGNES